MFEPTGDLELPAAEREELGRAALEWVLAWFAQTGARRLYPDVRAVDLQSMLAESLPEAAQGWRAALDEFAAQVAMGSRDNGHPRMFGYVQSSGTYVGAVADFLVSALNQNVTSWRSAPSATTLERQVIEWMKQLMRLPQQADGLLVSGGSMANLIAIAAAVAHACPDVTRRGIRGLPADPVIYASDTVHMSIPKAAAALGLGREAVHPIGIDADRRMDVSDLERAIVADRRLGRLPICVVANAGDVNTGAVDPLDHLADVCAREHLWLHADAAYGGFAVLAPSGREALAPLHKVDSLSLDPHKWLFAPVDTGCVLVRDGSALRKAFAYGADYVNVVASPEMSDYAFWDYGPELTRRFRALKIWMTLKTYGLDAIGAVIERNIRLARRLGALVDASDDFELLAPVPLSIVCFRHTGAGRESRAASLNDFNRELMLRAQREGQVYLSNAMIDGRFALRACIVNHRTRDEDVAALLDELRRCATLAGVTTGGG
jgi:aromatic-L-amino-acid/L-tryptophan decarboxylase